MANLIDRIVQIAYVLISKLSSAHVYLRQPESQPHDEWDKLPAALVNDAAQLVKANSIEGACVT